MRVGDAQQESSTAREANIAASWTRRLSQAPLTRLLEAVMDARTERSVTLIVFRSAARGTVVAESDANLSDAPGEVQKAEGAREVIEVRLVEAMIPWLER